MRKLLLGIFVFATALLVPALFFFQPHLVNNTELAWATLAICSLGVLMVAFCMNIKEQVDDNPYYIEMLKAKREQVRLNQKLASMTVKRR